MDTQESLRLTHFVFAFFLLRNVFLPTLASLAIGN